MVRPRAVCSRAASRRPAESSGRCSAPVRAANRPAPRARATVPGHRCGNQRARGCRPAPPPRPPAKKVARAAGRRARPPPLRREPGRCEPTTPAAAAFVHEQARHPRIAREQRRPAASHGHVHRRSRGGEGVECWHGHDDIAQPIRQDEQHAGHGVHVSAWAKAPARRPAQGSRRGPWRRGPR